MKKLGKSYEKVVQKLLKAYKSLKMYELLKKSLQVIYEKHAKLRKNLKTDKYFMRNMKYYEKSCNI